MEKRESFIHEINGTKLYFQFKEDRYQRGNLICYKLEVKPYIHTLYLDYTEKFNVELNESDTVFSGVNIIYIGSQVEDIIIENKMFPNVNLVTGKNDKYKIDTNILAKKSTMSYDGFDFHFCYKLLNTFCKQPGEKIDFSDIVLLRKNGKALDGCKTDNFINTERLIYSSGDFDNFQGRKTLKNGIVYCGPIPIYLDSSSEIIDVPENFPYKLIRPSHKPANKAIVHSIRDVQAKVIRIASDFVYAYNDEFKVKQLTQVWESCEKFEVDENNKYFTVFNGILYSKNMKKLILCPKKKTGSVVIPQGVTEICEQAFAECKIDSVSLPQSLSCVHAFAFHGSSISRIDFCSGYNINENSETDDIVIQRNAFSKCENLEEVFVPKRISKLGAQAFAWNDNLEKVILEDGFNGFQSSVFSGCKKLKSIELPSSVTYLGCSSENRQYSTFIQFEEIKINGVTIPDGLIRAITTYSTDARDSLKYGIVTKLIFNNDNVLYIPKYLSVNKISELENELPKFAHELCNIEENCLIKNVYKLSPSSYLKTLTAMKIFEMSENPSEDLKIYIKRSVKAITGICVNEGYKECFTKIITSNLFSKNSISYIMDRISEKDWVTAKAYLMQQTEKTNKQAFRL